MVVLADSRQAREQFSAGTFDVAIIDLGMPGIPGDQVAQRIRETDPAVATILFSGWELEQTIPGYPGTTTRGWPMPSRWARMDSTCWRH